MIQFERKRLWPATLWAALLAGFLPVLVAEEKPPGGSPQPIPVADLKRDTPVDFEKEVLPILKDNCLACHNQTKAKASLILETPQAMRKGGDTGPAIVPGKANESLLLKAATHLDPELIMPPRENKVNARNLTPQELALLKLWIDQGAQGEVRGLGQIAWQPLPDSVNPIFAVAITADGQFAACARANRIFVYHLPSGQLVARLVDAPLAAASGQSSAAHRDLVNALAFNPDGTLLASAAYREVKLWRRPSPMSKLTLGASNAVTALAVSPDRIRLATTAPGFAIALWDPANGTAQHILTGHSNAITGLRFSPNGALLCSVSLDKTIRLWNATNGTFLASTQTPSEMHAVAWVAEGNQIASAHADHVIRLWQLPAEPTHTLAALKELKGHTGPVTALETVPPAGKEFVSGSADGTMRHWNLEDGKVLHELKQGGPITAVAVRGDGKRFASAGQDKGAKLWDTEGKLIAELKGDRYAIEALGETERGLTLAKADVEYCKKSLENSEGEHKKSSERVAKATATNEVTEKVFAEKEKSLKAVGDAKAAAEKALADLLADIKKVTETFEAADKAAKEGSVRARAAAEKAAQLRVVAERAAQAKAETEKIAADTAALATRTKAAISTDLTEQAKALTQKTADEAAAAATRTKSVADAAAAEADAKAKGAAEAQTTADKAIEEVAALSFAAGQLKPNYDKVLAEAPEKKKQATNQVDTATKKLSEAEQELKKAERSKSITNHELDLAKQAEKRATDALAAAKTALSNAEQHQKKMETDLERSKKAAADSETVVRALAFAPDHLTLATAGDDQKIHTWNAESGAACEVFKAHSQAVSTLAFLDATSLLSGSDDQRALLWNLNPAWILDRTIGTGDAQSPLIDRVNAVRFSPEGQYLATGGGEPSRSGEIKIWQVADGKLWKEMANVHSDAVLSLDFSHDGKYLASGAADRFARITELDTGKVVKSFEGHTHHVTGVSWKRDGRTLATAGADNVVKIWDFVAGERRKNIEGASKEVTSIQFVSITDQAVATSGDGLVRALKENGETVRSFGGASDFVYSAAVTADGRLVVAGGVDSVLRVWNAADGQSLLTFAPPAAK
jgi:WD40 repeat protein